MRLSENDLRRLTPPELHPHLVFILDAIAEDTFAARNWDDEGDEYAKAASPAVIGRILTRVFHPALADRPIGFLWKQDLSHRGAPALATASKVSGKLRFYSGKDFLIVVNHSTWRDLDVAARIALLDHELCHCALNPETLAPVIVPHDIEEFDRIVKRWGLWDRRLERFAKVIRELSQGNLFDPVAVADQIVEQLEGTGAPDTLLPDGVESMTRKSRGRSITLTKPTPTTGAPA